MGLALEALGREGAGEGEFSAMSAMSSSKKGLLCREERNGLVRPKNPHGWLQGWRWQRQQRQQRGRRLQKG